MSFSWTFDFASLYVIQILQAQDILREISCIAGK